MAQLTRRQRTAIGAGAVILAGAFITAAALARSTSDAAPPARNGTLFADPTPSPSVSTKVSVVSPTVTVARTVTVTATVRVMSTATRTVTTTSIRSVRTVGAPITVNAGTGGQASVGGLSPGAAALGMAGVSMLAAGGVIVSRRKPGARL